MNGKPIIAIGLDGADHNLIQRWCDEGFLPTISSLMKQGCWGILDSTGDVSSGSVWSTFMTSVSPAKHGVFYGHRELKKGTYRIHKKYADEIKGKPFWYWLSNAGKRIAIFDIPHTYPIDGLNGFQIVAWGAFAPNWKISSSPPELINEILLRFGKHPLSGWYERRLNTINEYEEFCERLYTGIEKRGEISSYLLQKEPWDFFLMAFSEAHWAGHLLWHLIDDNHPSNKTRITNSFKNAIRDIYIAIDSTISKLIGVIPDATLLIFSLDGMGPNYSGKHLLPEVLKRMGIMGKPQQKTQPRLFSSTLKKLDHLIPARRWGLDSVKKVERVVPTNLIEIAKNMVPEDFWDYWTSRFLYANNDWRFSKAFCVPNEFHGTIRINLRGREPNGVVEQGTEYDKLSQVLIGDLSSLINLDTGESAVSEVIRVDEVYQGENIWELPDLIVKWVGDAPIRALYSPKIGTVTGKSPDARTGAHRPDGFIIFYGSNVFKGKTIERANIMDIGPTVLNLFGQSMPNEIDGRVLTDVFDVKFKESVKENAQ